MYCDTSILGIYIYDYMVNHIHMNLLTLRFYNFWFPFQSSFRCSFWNAQTILLSDLGQKLDHGQTWKQDMLFSFFWFCWSWHVVTVLFYSVNTFDPSNCWEINSWTFTSTLHADGCANIRNIRPTRSWFLKVRKHLKLLADLADRCLFWAWENRMCCTFGWCFLHQGADPVKKNG